MFQTLVKRGAEVAKGNPKSGKRFPHPMTLRLWFNRGALCLTAKVRQGEAPGGRSFVRGGGGMCVSFSLSLLWSFDGFRGLIWFSYGLRRYDSYCNILQHNIRRKAERF